jgi:hypothetical protein
MITTLRFNADAETSASNYRAGAYVRRTDEREKAKRF